MGGKPSVPVTRFAFWIRSQNLFPSDQITWISLRKVSRAVSWDTFESSHYKICQTAATSLQNGSGLAERRRLFPRSFWMNLKMRMSLTQSAHNEWFERQISIKWSMEAAYDAAETELRWVCKIIKQKHFDANGNCSASIWSASSKHWFKSTKQCLVSPTI